MTPADEILIRKDAAALISEHFGSSARLTSFSTKYNMYEMTVLIAGIPFHAYSYTSLSGAIDALIDTYNDYMRNPTSRDPRVEFPSACVVPFEYDIEALIAH